MVKFIETNLGNFIRVDTIEIVREDRGEWRAVLRDGSIVTLPDDFKPMIHLADIVPATAGYTAIGVVDDFRDEPPMFTESPIVGWRVVDAGYIGAGAIPVALDSLVSECFERVTGVKYGAVVHPDGRVSEFTVENGATAYPDVATWKVVAEKRHDEIYADAAE